jgi:2-polyprenyl-6-methoxyphenol hydroxylase-like FAD-dependent oxidoreductase
VAAPRALVIGGSLAGLFAANFLRTIGWDVTVFERSEADLAGRGTGLGTRPDLFDAMRRIGVRMDPSVGVEVRSRLGLDRRGEMFCEVPIRSVTTAWDRIYRALREVLPTACYRSGMRLLSFEMADRSVVASFEDGSRADGELLIGADGIRSTVRRQLMPQVNPRYAGYGAWRGVATELEVPPDFHETVFRHMNFCFPEGELALSVPMPAAYRGSQLSLRRCQFSWFRAGSYQGDSIPPVMNEEAVTYLKARAEVLLAPQLAALVRQCPQLILQPIFDFEAPHMAFQSAVLVGDAAFVARPHVGSGVTKAALDAQCLADALTACGGDIGAALARYERERLPAGRALVARGRYLGAYLENQRMRGTADRPVEVLMQEFGSAGVISAWESHAPRG